MWLREVRKTEGDHPVGGCEIDAIEFPFPGAERCLPETRKHALRASRESRVAVRVGVKWGTNPVSAASSGCVAPIATSKPALHALEKT